MAMSKGAKVAVGAGIAGLIVTVVGLVASRKAEAAPPEEPPEGAANLYGKVTDSETGAGIPGVEVTLEEGQGVLTDSGGNYQILNVMSDYFPVGVWVYFTKDGYEDRNIAFDLNEGNNQLNAQMVPTGGAPPEENVQVSNVIMNPTALTDAVHEYNTSLGLGYWGDPFNISIAYSNPFDFDVWVRPDYALGLLTGEPLEYVLETQPGPGGGGTALVLHGFDAKKLLYFRLLLQSQYIEGDYSYTTDWQKPYDAKGQNVGSNMQFVYDPDGVPRAGDERWIKVPAQGSLTMVKDAHLGKGISSLVPGVYDLVVVANRVIYFVYDPGCGQTRVGGHLVTLNWRLEELPPFAHSLPGLVSITHA